MIEYKSLTDKWLLHIFKDGKCLCPNGKHATVPRDPNERWAKLCKVCQMRYRAQTRKTKKTKAVCKTN